MVMSLDKPYRLIGITRCVCGHQESYHDKPQIGHTMICTRGCHCRRFRPERMPEDRRIDR